MRETNSSANERASAQREPPRMMRRSADSDPRIGHNIDNRRFARREAMARIFAEIELVMSIRYVERAGQLARTGTKIAEIIGPASLFHKRNAATRLDRTDQDQTIARPAFHEHVQHPVHPVIEINVGRARFVALHELTRAGSAEGVAGLVVLGEIRFGLDYDSFASSPHQRRADEVRCAIERIALEKFSPDQFCLSPNGAALYNTLAAESSIPPVHRSGTPAQTSRP
jgi:hypothetical protein